VFWNFRPLKNNINNNFMKNLNLIVTSFVILSTFVVAGVASVSEAATYLYVNDSGNVTSVDASSVSGAFTNSINIGTHSGVMLISNSNTVLPENTSFDSRYVYVNDTGTVTEVDANSSSGAFTNSINIADRSGVMLIDSISDSNTVGDSVSGY
jgi:hypothetical protein